MTHLGLFFIFLAEGVFGLPPPPSYPPPPPIKCCPANHVLRADPSSPHSRFECLEVGFIRSSVSFLPERIFNVTEEDNSRRLIPAPWSEEQVLGARREEDGRPVCEGAEAAGRKSKGGSSITKQKGGGGPWRLLDMSNPFLHLVTTEGELFSLGGDFELGFPLGDFCLDLILREEGEGEAAEHRRREEGGKEGSEEESASFSASGGGRGGNNRKSAAGGGGEKRRRRKKEMPATPSHLFAAGNGERMSYGRAALICDHCRANTCIPTCCHHLQTAAYNGDGDFFCKNRLPVTFEPPRWTPVFADADDPADVDYALVHSSVDECEVNAMNRHGLVLDMLGHGFDVFSNGSLALYDDPRGDLVTTDRYCLAFAGVTDDGTSLRGAYVRMCPGDEGQTQTLVMTKAYPFCCMVSNLFLMATFLVYLALPELRRPLFGKVIMAFVLALFFAYLFISVIAFGHLELIMNKAPGEEFSVGCRVLGFLVLFFFLHTFAWMNVLSYDIFRKFTRFRRRTASSEQSDRVRLAKYAAYAFGLPTVVTLVTLTVEFLPDSYDGLRPGFGVRTCFFDTELASFLFFHLYLLVMQGTNLVLFSLTCRSLFQTWRATRKLGQHSGGAPGAAGKSAGKGINDQISLIAKLYVVMGITWMSEFVTFLLSWIFGDEAVWKYTVFNDIINLSQGILIFAVLVCKRSVFLKLRDRIRGEGAKGEDRQPGFQDRSPRCLHQSMQLHQPRGGSPQVAMRTRANTISLTTLVSAAGSENNNVIASGSEVQKNPARILIAARREVTAATGQTKDPVSGAEAAAAEEEEETSEMRQEATSSRGGREGVVVVCEEDTISSVTHPVKRASLGDDINNDCGEEEIDTSSSAHPVSRPAGERGRRRLVRQENMDEGDPGVTVRKGGGGGGIEGGEKNGGAIQPGIIQGEEKRQQEGGGDMRR